jgi:hypothetical protein
MRQPRAVRQSAFRTVDPILDRCIDLILDRTLDRPTRSHSRRLLKNEHRLRLQQRSARMIPPTRYVKSWKIAIVLPGGDARAAAMAITLLE